MGSAGRAVMAKLDWSNTLKDVAATIEHARPYGKTAIVVCEEVLDGGVLAATNIFIEELGSWHLIHHQASPIAIQIEEAEAPPPRHQLH